MPIMSSEQTHMNALNLQRWAIFFIESSVVSRLGMRPMPDLFMGGLLSLCGRGITRGGTPFVLLSIAYCELLSLAGVCHCAASFPCGQ